MSRLLCVVLLSIALPCGAADTTWQTDPADKLQASVADTIERFLAARPELAGYFDEAWGYAVFPRILKAGAMFGGAWGKGLVIEQGRLVGRCSQLLASLGAQFGGQSYRQLILFRNEDAMQTFKRGRIEFNGRASAVVLTAGAAVDPANLPDVAIFTLVEGGLMLEASAAGVKYGYKPLATD